MCHKVIVPLKIFIFSWKLFNDRLSKKSNLIWCDTLSTEAQMYNSGCGAVELSQHLFVDIFRKLWSMILYWFGVYVTFPYHISSCTYVFSSLFIRDKRLWDCLIVVWKIRVRSTWRARNFCVFVLGFCLGHNINTISNVFRLICINGWTIPLVI